jgi:hypothetical protein
MNDLVIGSGYNLSWEQCRVWVNSLNQSGFEGDKIFVYFGQNQELFDKMNENGFAVATFPSLTAAHNICVVRFAAYAAILNAPNAKIYDWVIATDVTDVVFQKNPMDYINNLKKVDHLASDENLMYKDEPWGKNNLTLSFGSDQYERQKQHIIRNAGVIAAHHQRMADISNLIFIMSQGRPQHVYGGGGPDQAAYNIIMGMLSLNRNTEYGHHDNAWACQCGTTMDKNKPDLIKMNVGPLPKFNGEYVVNSVEEPYHIVHQYNRVPELKEYFERKYNV